MGKRSGQRDVGRRGIAYISVAGLAVVALTLSALILFLRRRARDAAHESIEYSVEQIPETPEIRAKEVYPNTPETKPQEEAPERSTDREQSPVENQREGATEDAAEERRQTVREFARRLEEHPASREGRKAQDASAETGEEAVGTAETPTPAGEEPSRDTGSSSGAAEEETGYSDEKEAASGQATVVGVLAKMGEAYQEVGGTRFILSSEDAGNFDLLGKEDELDDVYQQQVSARVVGKIVEDDSPTRKIEVDEVEPA